MFINFRTGVTFSESVLLLSNNLILLLMSARFDFSNSFIWFEFYNAPLTKDIKLICDVSERLFFFNSSKLLHCTNQLVFWADYSLMVHHRTLGGL